MSAFCSPLAWATLIRAASPKAAPTAPPPSPGEPSPPPQHHNHHNHHNHHHLPSAAIRCIFEFAAGRTVASISAAIHATRGSPTGTPTGTPPSSPAGSPAGSTAAERPPVTAALARTPLAPLMPLVDGRQTYTCPEARSLWRSLVPKRVVDRSLGYPILVCDDDGEYLEHGPEVVDEAWLARVFLDTADEGAAARNEGHGMGGVEEGGRGTRRRRLRSQIMSGYMGKLEVKGGGVAGLGVFAAETFEEGSLVGPYVGTVMTMDEFEDFEELAEELAEEQVEEQVEQGRVGEAKEEAGEAQGEANGASLCASSHAAAGHADGTACIQRTSMPSTSMPTSTSSSPPLPSSTSCCMHHAFVLNDGAHAVVLDGERGLVTNQLKYINHR